MYREQHETEILKRLQIGLVQKTSFIGQKLESCDPHKQLIGSLILNKHGQAEPIYAAL